MQALERAHVRGQTHFGPHLKAYRGMLHVGFSSRNWRDVRAQIKRIALVPIGLLFSRLP